MTLRKEILTDQLSETIGSRKVIAAVFTTFNFDPSFFELYILPLLFPDQNFSPFEKVRLLQLEDCLRALPHLAVYFDASAISHDGNSPKLGYSRIDVRWKRGVFHPKLILLLVKRDDPAERPSLIVTCQSANITRSGWWENVECSHIEEVHDKRVSEVDCSYRGDLLSLLGRIKRSCPKDNHDALDLIHRFVLDRVAQTNVNATGQDSEIQTRIYGGIGNRDFADWLKHEVKVPLGLNLEVVSPYFDQNDVQPLKRIVEATEPRSVNVFLPQKSDGSAEVSADVYESVDTMKRTKWANLPNEIVSRSTSGRAAADDLTDRFVHAKLYRFWKQGERGILVLGSVNCTSAATNPPGTKNLEAAFCLDATHQRIPNRALLKPINSEITEFAEKQADESDDSEDVQFSVYLRYNWATHELTIRSDDVVSTPFEIRDLANDILLRIEFEIRDTWHRLAEQSADKVRDAIGTSSLVGVHCENDSWRILIREEGCSHRPSLLDDLTPEEILKYWSMLTTEQRTSYLERVMQDRENLEGLRSDRSPLRDTTNSVFHQFSGIFHAFGHLKRHVIDSLQNNLEVDAEYRLFGKKYDSLPQFLEKFLDKEDVDPVNGYVTFLSARDLINDLKITFSEFFAERQLMVDELNDLIDEGLKFRDQLELSQRKEFLQWFETNFLS